MSDTSTFVHPAQALLGAQAGATQLPVCDHYSGVEARMRKSLSLQAELTAEYGHCVFDVTLDGTRHTVYVQVQPGVYEPRQVVPGNMGPRQVVITSGLNVGEQVVAENALLLARQFAVSREGSAAPTAAPGTAPKAAAPKAAAQ